MYAELLETRERNHIIVSPNKFLRKKVSIFFWQSKKKKKTFLGVFSNWGSFSWTTLLKFGGQRLLMPWLAPEKIAKQRKKKKNTFLIHIYFSPEPELYTQFACIHWPQNQQETVTSGSVGTDTNCLAESWRGTTTVKIVTVISYYYI